MHNFRYFSLRWKNCLSYGKIAVHPLCESISWLWIVFLLDISFRSFLILYEIIRTKMFSLSISRLYSDKCYDIEEDLYNSELPLKFILALCIFIVDYSGFLERYIFGPENFSSYGVVIPLLQSILMFVKIFNFPLFLPIKLAINEIFIHGVSWSCYLSVLRLLEPLRLMLLLIEIKWISASSQMDFITVLLQIKQEDRISWVHYLAYHSDSMSILNSFKEIVKNTFSNNISRENVQNGIMKSIWTMLDIWLLWCLYRYVWCWKLFAEIYRLFISGEGLPCEWN